MPIFPLFHKKHSKTVVLSLFLCQFTTILDLKWCKIWVVIQYTSYLQHLFSLLFKPDKVYYLTFFIEKSFFIEKYAVNSLKLRNFYGKSRFWCLFVVLEVSWLATFYIRIIQKNQTYYCFHRNLLPNSWKRVYLTGF